MCVHACDMCVHVRMAQSRSCHTEKPAKKVLHHDLLKNL